MVWAEVQGISCPVHPTLQLHLFDPCSMLHITRWAIPLRIALGCGFLDILTAHSLAKMFGRGGRFYWVVGI